MNAEAARDEMFAVFRDGWVGAGQSLSRVVWDDLTGAVPGVETPWARVSLRHATGGQSSLAGASGGQLYTQTGLILVQIFAPMGDGRKTSTWLAQDVVNAYRNARGSVWYRNARMREVGAAGAFDQTNVYAEFTYDD